MPATDPNHKNGQEPDSNLPEEQPQHNLTATPRANSEDDLKTTPDLEIDTESLSTTVINDKPVDNLDTNDKLELIHDNPGNNFSLPDLNQQQNDLKIKSLKQQEPVIKTKLKINHDNAASSNSVSDKAQINYLATSDFNCSNNHQLSTITFTLAKSQNSSSEKCSDNFNLTNNDTGKVINKTSTDELSSNNDKVDVAQDKSSNDRINKVEDKHKNSEHKSEIDRHAFDKSTSTADETSNAEDESLNSSNETESGSIEIEGVGNSCEDVNDGNSTSSGEELDESGDLQLAAELGKTLLERNRELEASIKQHQAVIDDQSQEIEYLTKQTSVLREVNESRVKVYEQLEISLQEAEELNGRLLAESNSDKARIKSLSGIVDNLEQKCEELQELLKFQDTNKQENGQENGTGKSKKSRKKNSISGSHRKISATSQLHGVGGLLSLGSHGCSSGPDEDYSDGEGNLEDGVSRMTGGNRNEGTSSSCSNANSSSGFYSSASCKEQEICRLELEVVQLTSDLETMQEQNMEDAKRIKELEQQVVALLCENNSLSCCGGKGDTDSPHSHTHDPSHRGCHHILTQLEASWREGGDEDGRAWATHHPQVHLSQDDVSSGSGTQSISSSRFNRLNPPTHNCLCSEVLKADCLQLMNKVKELNSRTLSHNTKDSQSEEKELVSRDQSADPAIKSRDQSADPAVKLRDQSADLAVKSRDQSADPATKSLYQSADHAVNKSTDSTNEFGDVNAISKDETAVATASTVDCHQAASSSAVEIVADTSEIDNMVVHNIKSDTRLAEDQKMVEEVVKPVLKPGSVQDHNSASPPSQQCKDDIHLVPVKPGKRGAPRGEKAGRKLSDSSKAKGKENSPMVAETKQRKPEDAKIETNNCHNDQDKTEVISSPMNYSAVLMKNSHTKDDTDDQTNATTDAKVDPTNSNENDVINEDVDTVMSSQQETVFISYIRKKKPKSNHKITKEVMNGSSENSTTITNSKTFSTKDIVSQKEHENMPNNYNESSEKSTKFLDFHLDMVDRASSSLSSADGGPCSLQEELQMSGEYHQSVETSNGNLPHSYNDSALENGLELDKYDNEKMPPKADLNKTDEQIANNASKPCPRCLKCTESTALQAVSTQCALESVAVSSQCTAEGTICTTESQFRQIFREIFQVLERAKRIPEVKTCSRKALQTTNCKTSQKHKARGTRSKINARSNEDALREEEYPILTDNHVDGSISASANNNSFQPTSYAEILRKGIK